MKAAVSLAIVLAAACGKDEGVAPDASVTADASIDGGTPTYVACGQALPGPVLVAYGSITATQRTALAAAALSFAGDATIASFKPIDADAVRNVARRFTVPAKRGPHALPNVRVVVGDLVEGRTFEIERTPATQFAGMP